MGSFLQDTFLHILNMSITASYVIMVVCFIRLLLKKAPKIYSYMLWTVVLFRLICPFSFSSAISFFNFIENKDLEYIPSDIGTMMSPQINLGINSINQSVNNALPAANPISSINPMEIILFGASIIWVLGIIILLIYSMISYLKLKRKVATAVLFRDNIFQSENISSPFVLGIILPRIYLPLGLREVEKSYILKHEQIHIKRFDYVIKPLTFLILCIHWFNPLVWMSFRLMNKDMEMSCDERVLKEIGTEIKKDYSISLLSLAVDRRMIGGSPLAFGESSAKSRIKNILNYKRPSFWVGIAAMIMIGSISFVFMANPINDELDLSFLNVSNTASAAIQQEKLIIRVHGHGATFVSGEEFGKWLDGVSDTWMEDKVSKEPVPTFTVYINNGFDYAVNFYSTNLECAQIIYGDQSRYYTIPKEHYNEVYMMWAVRNYLMPEEMIGPIIDGKRTNIKSVQDVPAAVDYKELKVGNRRYYLYEKNGKYYCEAPYEFINEITEKMYKDATRYAEPTPDNPNMEGYSEVADLVEDNLSTIMSSPKSSSNPQDYIEAHDKAYEKIIKYGGEEALTYMLLEFEQGRGEGLRGQLMMNLCKEILGVRNNVKDESLSPQEWYEQLQVRKKMDVPNFKYMGNDPIEKLVYETELQNNHGKEGTFTIIAPHIFGSYEEGKYMKVFVTTYTTSYTLYEKTLSKEGGSVIPAAITYIKNDDGSYTLEKYEMAQDGSYFGPSIKEFCVLPQSGIRIRGLADKILNHYGDYKDLFDLERKNLTQHLKENGYEGVFLYEKHYQAPAELTPIT